MRIIILIFLLITLTFSFGFAQNKQTDSLMHQLSIAKQDTSRVLIMAGLAEWFRLMKPDTAMKYGQKALILAKKIKFLKGEAAALNKIGGVYRELGDLPKAIDFALKALRIAEENQYFELINSCNNTFGIVYYDLQEFPKAISYYQKANKMAKKTGNQRAIFSQYGNIGAAYIGINQLDSGMYYTKLAYEGGIRLKLDERLATHLRNFGRIEAKLGNNQRALAYFKESIQASNNVKDPRNAAYTYNEIAKFFLKMNQPDSCIVYAKKGLVNGKIGPFNIRILESSTLLAEAYKAQNDLKQAYEYQELMIKTKESLFGAGNIQTMQAMIAADEARRKKTENERIMSLNKLRQYGLLAGLAMFLLISFILYRNNRQKHEANTVLEKTLTELKSTQSQLIQSEKLASLGELTAGIAHEIQNPLNFVNNFSELNAELIDELELEIKQGNLENAIAIANDLKGNEQKITHHGQRASAIVKGMLEHSRTSTGVNQPTKINMLADEYLRMAHHSFLAKNPDFIVKIETHFQENLPPLEVIPQDIGRVLLNLFNNAFYAVHQRALDGAPLVGAQHADTQHAGAHEKRPYEPTVTVSTQKTDGQIVIKVKDNGTGIPDDVKDKIFQPFFTTKPTGQGTGLGLSLAYDIVTKGHGGTLGVECKEGAATIFTLTLPIE